MQFLRKYSIVFLYCSVLANKKKVEEKMEINTSGKSSLANYIKSQKIIINNREIVMVEDAINATNFFDHNKYKTFDTVKQLDMAARASKILFLAQKCKYSNLIINVLRMYFESILACQKLIVENAIKNVKISNEIQISLNRIIKSTIDLKIYIVKFIFSTNKMMKSSLNLKSTDHTLTKTLLAINLCLFNVQIYINKHENDLSVISSNIDKLFAQMINLIEYFRCKNCYITDYFESNIIMKNKINEALSRNNLIGLISETLKTLQIHNKYVYLSNIDPKSGGTYDDNMYNPEYMLLEHVLDFNDYSFIPTLFVRWKNSSNWSELINVYTEVSKSFDLRTVHDYQIFIIETIKEMFFIKFLNTKLQPSDDIKNLMQGFEIFIDKMIPTNYPTHLFVPIKEVLNFLHNDMRSISTESYPFLSNRSIEILRKVSIITTLSTSVYNINEMLEKLSMKDFIQKIVTHGKFDIFIEIFEELLYESHALDNYNFRRVYTFKNNQNFVNKNENMCNDLSLTRKNLILFQMLILRFQRDNVELGVDTSVQEAKTHVLDNLMHLYRTYGSQDKIRRILLPLMVRFKHTCYKNDDYKTLFQISVLNTNLIEHFELTNCPSPEYNTDMFYDEVKSYKVLNLTLRYETEGSIKLQQTFWQNKEKITHKIKSNTKDHRLSDKKRIVDSMIIDQFVPNVDLEYLGDKSNNSTLSLWDGAMERVDSVSLAIPQSIIDYQHLFSHECFVMKWIIPKIVMNLLNCILIYDPAKSNEANDRNIDTTINHLTRFEELPFPKSIKQHLRDIFDAFDSMFRDLTKKTKRKYSSNIITRLDSLQTSLEGLSVSVRIPNNQNDIGSINTLIEKDMSFLRSVLNSIDHSKIISRVPFSSCIFV